MLLRSCPGVQVLATSRETLGLVGEYAWQVLPLSTPPDAAASSLATVKRYGAAQLFLERATPATVRGLTDADAPALGIICTGLDGLPLAIELAAARTAVLTVTEIAERLDDPALLSARGPADPPHHRALHETIAWSVDHLEPAVRSRFLRLAVFVGGFTLSAAEAVWPDGGDRPGMDVLSELVTKSLVVMQRRPAGARYHLLDTIRRYAVDRLADQPAEERAARARHANAYLALAERADEQIRGPQAGGWLIRLTEEHENLRAALTWFAADDPTSDADVRLALALAQYCRLSGRYGDGRHWLESALVRHTDTGLTTTTAGRALAAAAVFAFLVGDYADAQAYAERALPVHRRCDDEAGTSRTLRLLASIARERGDYRHSLACLDESLGLAKEDPAAEADVLQSAGFTAWLAGSVDSADRLLRLALRRYERLGDAENVASTRIHMAAAALYAGRTGRAHRLADSALRCFTSLDAKEGIAWALNVLGLAACTEGRWAEALVSLRGSLDVHHALGDRWRQASLLDAIAAARLAGGEPTVAAELTGLAAMLRRLLDGPVPAVERPGWRQTHATLRGILPVAERRAAYARGGTTRVADVLTEG
jgi:predicted ATPase